MFLLFTCYSELAWPGPKYPVEVCNDRSKCSILVQQIIATGTYLPVFELPN